ncbi:hypothetical protein GCM10023264_12100 [Sphingomonas daechungensis]|uniref:hypothetical protein n=1 Tax=Sphingomonas daechungensis TaxID=1176646 RepID=UPI0031EE8672
MPEPEKNKQGREPNTAKAGAASTTAEQLKRYGIVMVPRPVYEWGGYRYGNPEDAIAAAKRAENR